jgi:hypothetical protein
MPGDFGDAKFKNFFNDDFIFTPMQADAKTGFEHC